MGQVDLAIRREGNFRRLYAIKRLHPHLRDDQEFRDMFLDEARIAGLLHHANVVSVLDMGEDTDGPFLVLDYVDGLPLSRLASIARRREEPIPIQVALRMAAGIARGLHAAHSLVDHGGQLLNLVHRDLSPHNVLVGYDGTVRITDFGIAKALGRTTRTDTGVLKGKVSYMSPEQLRFREPDHRSDLFALGVVLFEMLAGRRLYKNREGADGVRRILDEPPPDLGEDRPDAPPELTALLFELLAKEPEDRPADASAVVRRLEQMLGESLASEEPIEVGTYVLGLAEETLDRREEIAEAVKTTRIQTRSESQMAPPRRRWAAAAGALLLVLAVAAGWSFMREPAVEPAPESVASSPRVVEILPPSETARTESSQAPAQPIPSPAEEVAVTAAETAVEPPEASTVDAPTETLRKTRPRSRRGRRSARRRAATKREEAPAEAAMSSMSSDQRTWEDW